VSKKVVPIENHAGGIDLITERDAGNEIRILTGDPQYSLEFWENIKEHAELAVQTLKERIKSVAGSS